MFLGALKQRYYAAVLALYAVLIVCCKCHTTVECPSVCLSRQSTAAVAAGGFAAEVGHGLEADIDR